MSSKDARHTVIVETIPHLIKSLTGLKETDERFVRVESNALSKIQFHHYLSVNSHEIQRRMESVAERFVVANFSSYAKRLVELCDLLKDDPLCKEHYENDIQWALLSFLLEVSQKPVAGLEANKNEIRLSATHSAVLEESRPLPSTDKPQIRTKLDSNEDLSEWSDSEEEEDPIVVSNSDKPPSSKPVHKTILPGIKPPGKENYFQLYDETDPNRWLRENVQTAWWLDADYLHPVHSEHVEANFCQFWQKHLGQVEKRILSTISTISEYHMMREILWMFIAPTTCKTFVVDETNSTVKVAAGVSLNTLSETGLQSFLELFARHMTVMLRLNTFCSVVHTLADRRRAPHSYETYSQSLQECMRPFNDWLLATEAKLAQEDAQYENNAFSLVWLHRTMEPYGRFLDNLYDIHTKCSLDFIQYPAHICSSYLIAALLSAYSTSSSNCHSNLVAVIFVGAIKVYLQIIDTWWTEGRLEDWRNEFIIKSVDHVHPLTGLTTIERTDGCEVRLLSANQDCAFYIRHHVSSTIESCKLTKMLCQHALDAGYTLSILHTLDRIGEINSQDGYQDNLYKSFWEMTVNKMHAFSSSDEQMPHNNKTPLAASMSDEKLSKLRSSLTMGSVLLGPVVAGSLKKFEYEAKSGVSSGTLNAHALFERWTESSPALQHFEEIVFQNLRSLLESRIASANRCVLGMYLDEYQVLGHLTNLQKVYFLEAGDLMFLFYSSLFKQIETSDNWNNSYLLTDQLNGIICTKYPEMSSLFSVQVPARKFDNIKVTEAIDRISIKYAVPPCLRDIISDYCLSKYNKVFRNLLKIKWGLWRLENMRFPMEQKKRPPYKPMTYFDLAFKRLVMVRNWVLHTLQCVHSHLMTQVVQSMSDHLNAHILQCATLTNIIAVHKSFINTIHDHCFLTVGDSVMVGVDQLLNLVTVVRNEWTNLTVDEVDSVDHQQINDIEKSFIECHRYISGELDKQLYSKNRNYLSGLCAAFSSSSPY